MCVCEYICLHTASLALHIRTHSDARTECAEVQTKADARMYHHANIHRLTLRLLWGGKKRRTRTIVLKRWMISAAFNLFLTTTDMHNSQANLASLS